MVQDKTLPWKPAHKLRCRGKMLGVNKNVVGEPELLQHGNAAQEIRLQQEIVPLALNNVPNSNQFFPASKRFQVLPQLRRTQIRPANDSEDERIVFGQFQEPSGLFECLSNLNQHASLKSVLFQLWLQVSRQKITDFKEDRKSTRLNSSHLVISYA